MDHTSAIESGSMLHDQWSETYSSRVVIHPPANMTIQAVNFCHTVEPQLHLLLRTIRVLALIDKKDQGRHEEATIERTNASHHKHQLCHTQSTFHATNKFGNFDFRSDIRAAIRELALCQCCLQP